MFHHKENVTITLRIEGFTTTEYVPCSVLVRWVRHRNVGSTASLPLTDLTFIEFNQSFPMVCNFVTIKGAWRSKIVTLDIFMSTEHAKSRIATWQIDLAVLHSTDIVTNQLTTSSSPLGELTLMYTLCRGPPSVLENLQKSSTRLARSRSDKAAPSLLNMHHTLLVSQDDATAASHGLGSLRRNAAKHQSTSIVPRGNNPFNSQFTMDLDKINRTLFDNPDITKLSSNGYPQYGENVTDLILKQPRGTSMESGIPMITQSLYQRAISDFNYSVNSFVSCLYIYTEMQDNGLSTIAPHVDMKVKLFDLLEIVTTKAIGIIDDNHIDEIKNIIQPYMNAGNEFCTYVMNIVLYKILSGYSNEDKLPICEALGFDINKMNTRALDQLQPETIKKLCDDMIDNCPIPPIV